MTDTEKKLLQAQHRLEEAQARDRVKERKARTRRLIQEGAILEKVLPEVRTMEPSALEDYLMQKLPQRGQRIYVFRFCPSIRNRPFGNTYLYLPRRADYSRVPRSQPTSVSDSLCASVSAGAPSDTEPAASAHFSSSSRDFIFVSRDITLPVRTHSS